MKTVLLTAVFAVVFGPIWDLRFVLPEAQKYANEHRVDVLIWKLPKEPRRPQRWVATTQENRPDQAVLDTTVHPR